MSTIRTDPVTGRKVIIASERADRPRAFPDDDGSDSEPDRCPFCRGNEDATPPQIATYRADGEDEGWGVRVVPNKFPAVSPETELVERADGFHSECTGVGAHEVIVECPDHLVDVTDIGAADFEVVLRAWQDRIRDLARDERLDYAVVFKNHGRPAGASLEHAHSQLVALPFVPRQAEEQLEGSSEYYDRTGDCIYCALVERATETRERLVYANDRVVVLAPYASRFPFELMVLPRPHGARFEAADEDLRHATTEAFLEVVGRLETALESPPFNAVLHTAPLRSGSLDHFHWHFGIIPTLSHIAGFEWGSGSHINPTPPERAAEHLRRIASDASDA